MTETSPQSITCSCSNLYNFYYTIITDIERDLEKPREKLEMTHSNILFAISIPLILLGSVMPILMVYLDSADYQKVEDNFFNVDDLIVAKLQYARNYLCRQEIYYREKEISQYK